ncbi:substrate-binding periplasmic protein [Pseudoduganella umbonata]|uniref:Polar amino acid transport system substrate-binding protein n=1 Tax=Pseudoduganella umbonata TaxID=864828 RepID=A0A4P8HTU1_9BURK|nr:transporter substrate-binding domain-containing protein [Pseudoduganella umbonata]MBB3220557.1 polar amino acid transport system substrate-binding protein [Pseudoduganella umbonata]QCP11934.1 transporter substrate-binding domain-containing protein [Pseudoduganella umbonata]
MVSRLGAVALPALAALAASTVLAALTLGASRPAAAAPATKLGTKPVADAPAAWPHLVITGEHTPPTSMLVDGKPTGRQTDKVREMLERAGVPHTIDLLPWKRAYMKAQRDPLTCVYSTTRTAEREAGFKWVGPIVQSDWVLMARADRPLQLRTLEDARPLRIGTYGGDARDDYLRSRGFNVEAVQNDDVNAEKLLMNRIDLWAVAARPELKTTRRLGRNGQLVPVLVFNRVGLYLACHRSVPEPLVERMNAVLDTMRRDGSLDRIDRRYDAVQ